MKFYKRPKGGGMPKSGGIGLVDSRYPHMTKEYNSLARKQAERLGLRQSEAGDMFIQNQISLAISSLHQSIEDLTTTVALPLPKPEQVDERKGLTRGEALDLLHDPCEGIEILHPKEFLVNEKPVRKPWFSGGGTGARG